MGKRKHKILEVINYQRLSSDRVKYLVLWMICLSWVGLGQAQNITDLSSVIGGNEHAYIPGMGTACGNPYSENAWDAIELLSLGQCRTSAIPRWNRPDAWINTFPNYQKGDYNTQVWDRPDANMKYIREHGMMEPFILVPPNEANMGHKAHSGDPDGFFPGYEGWKKMGKAIADRYKPNSDWWKSQGIHNYGVRYYAAINEPSHSRMGNWYSLDQYYDALRGYADGIHESDPSLVVMTGGIMTYTIVGNFNKYLRKIIPLINNGTLDAINVHRYYNDRPLGWDNSSPFFDDVYNTFSMQGKYKQLRDKYGMKDGVPLFLDEFGLNRDWDQYQNIAAKMLTGYWDCLGVIDQQGNPVTIGLHPWAPHVEDNNNHCTIGSKFGMWSAIKHQKRLNAYGRVTQMMTWITQDMQFTHLDPWNTGIFMLNSPKRDKKLWVWQNRPHWSSYADDQTYFDVTGIPPGTTKLEVFYYDSWNQPANTKGTPKPAKTITINGETTKRITGLRTNETIMILGDAAQPGSGGEPPVKEQVAYWKCNESSGTEVRDDLANRHGILQGNTSGARVAGVDGNALQFGPADRWVDVPADEAFSLNEITLSCWIKLDQAVGGWRTIIEHDRSGSNWYGLFMRDGGAGLHFRWSRRQTLNGVQQLEANRWYHVAATFDATTKTAKLYIDGELDATRTGGGGMTKRLSALRIGANLAGKEVFPGSVDEVQLFSKALSAREIKALSETFTSPGDPGSPGSMTVSVTASADDAEQNLSTGTMDVSSSDLDFASTGLCAMRFSLDIPKGATITSARLLLVSKDNTSGANTLLIKGHVANNSSPFSNSSRNISSRNTTGASVSWEPGPWTDGQTYTSPGLETIVQEVVGRRRWSAGNYLGLIVSAATGNKRLARSYDYGGAGDAPKLEVTYTTTASNARVGEREQFTKEVSIHPSKVNIYPNPVESTLAVQFQPGNERVQHRKLVVYSLQGHTLIMRDVPGEEKDITLDVSLLKKGIYMMKIYSGKETEQFRLIKE